MLQIVEPDRSNTGREEGSLIKMLCKNCSAFRDFEPPENRPVVRSAGLLFLEEKTIFVPQNS